MKSSAQRRKTPHEYQTDPLWSLRKEWLSNGPRLSEVRNLYQLQKGKLWHKFRCSKQVLQAFTRSPSVSAAKTQKQNNPQRQKGFKFYFSYIYGFGEGGRSRGRINQRKPNVKLTHTKRRQRMQMTEN